jgi:hypothetical protein
MLDENQYPPSFDTINKVNNIIYSDFFFKWRFFFKTFFFTDHSRRGFCDKVGREIHLLFLSFSYFENILSSKSKWPTTINGFTFLSEEE